MVSFDAHLLQAGRNLSALQIMADSDHCDWQVTISFYAALHLISAHMAMSGEQANRHDLIKNKISPFSPGAKAEVDEETFGYYCSLEDLSRIARYLHTKEKRKTPPLKEVVASRIDASEALVCLNAIMLYFSRKYNVTFEKFKGVF